MPDKKMSVKDGNVRNWTSGQRDEIISSTIKNLPKLEENVPFDLVKELIDKPITLQRRIRQVFFPGVNGLVKKIEGVYPESLLEFHEGWVEFFKCFGIKIDLNDYPLPEFNKVKLKDGIPYWSILWPSDTHSGGNFALDILKQIIPNVKVDMKDLSILDLYPRIKTCLTIASINPSPNRNKYFGHENCQRHGIFGTTFTQGCLINARMVKDFNIYLDIGKEPEPMSKYIPGDKDILDHNVYTIHPGSVFISETGNAFSVISTCGWREKCFRAWWVANFSIFAECSYREIQF